ncbi:MAG: hypothetical protein ACTSPY_08515 [Candidatus Helarchaeota archaeon]
MKDGVPIFYWSYKDEEFLSEEQDNRNTVLISGFLSAIVSFTNEIGIGEPRSYLTQDVKFSFLIKNGFLFVITVDKNIPDEKSFEFLTVISKTFISVYDIGDFSNLSTINFQNFKDYLFEIIKKFNIKEITDVEIDEQKIVEETNKDQLYKNLVPKCYIDIEKNKHLSNSRRALFKLIDGNNSIYQIAQSMNENPINIYYTLRPYEKFGYIRIKNTDSK